MSQMWGGRQRDRSFGDGMAAQVKSQHMQRGVEVHPVRGKQLLQDRRDT